MKAFTVQSARDLGLQFKENPHRMVGQDGAYSIPFDGRTLWFFGDTLMGRRTAGESLWFPGGAPLGPEDMSGKHGIDLLRTNTGLVLENRTGREGLTRFSYICDGRGVPRQLVPHEEGEDPDEIRVWCLHGVEMAGRMYLYYLTVRMLAEGPMPVNFELVGAGLSSGRTGEWSFRRLPGPNGSLWWKWPLPQFGSAVLRVEEDVYLYGVRKGGDGTQQCCLARVAADAIGELSAYRYWAGVEAGWSDDPRQCTTIMTGMPNEMSVSWNEYLGAYLAVHSLDLSGLIVGRTAPNPWGPWSGPVTLWKVRPPTLDYPIPYDPLIYAGKEHPALAEESGRVLYLTYIEFEEYFPHLVEVTLE